MVQGFLKILPQICAFLEFINQFDLFDIEVEIENHLVTNAAVNFVCGGNFPSRSCPKH